MKGVAHILILFYLGILMVKPINAQHVAPNCQHTQSFQKLFFQDVFSRNQKAIKTYLQDDNLKNRSYGFIPLVFHFVLNEATDSISHEQVLAQMEVLNECFSGQNRDLSGLDPIFREFTTYEGPRFCLASREENGELTKGIEYQSTTESYFGDQIEFDGNRSIKHSFSGGLDAWDATKYLNIWIGDLEFAQGEATFPNMADPDELGIVIDPKYFGVHLASSQYYPFHLGKTLVHEMGHYFNLKHLWGDEASCESDDGIGDTPLQEIIYTGCPDGQQISCSSIDMHMNFLNFTEDECLIHFTKEQMDHVNAVINLFYPDLLSYDHCYPKSTSSGPLDKIEIKLNLERSRIELSLEQATAEKIDLLLYQADGKLIISESLFNESFEEISLINLPTGIYILFLRTEDNFLTRKLFVY